MIIKQLVKYTDLTIYSSFLFYYLQSHKSCQCTHVTFLVTMKKMVILSFQLGTHLNFAKMANLHHN